jgi:hypothetical protein
MFTPQNFAIGAAFVGLLIIAATVVRALKAGSAPFGLSAGKDGVKVETNFIGASLLVGLTIFLGSGYFFIGNYERRVEELTHKLDELKSTLNEFLEHAKGVDLNARLQFTNAASANDVKEASIVINREGAIQVLTYQTKPGFEPNERSITIPGLHTGDDIRILVNTGGTNYHSKQSIHIPNSSIEMVPD